MTSSDAPDKTASRCDVASIHRDAYPIDTHLDSLYLARVAGYDFWKGDWTATRKSSCLWLIRKLTPAGRNHPHCHHVHGQDFLAGGFGGACFSAHALWENLLPARLMDPWTSWLVHRDYVDAVVAASGGVMRRTPSVKAVRDAQAGAKRSAILAVEGAHCLGPFGPRHEDLRLARLETLSREGVAYLTLNHFCNTDISEAGYAVTNPWRRIPGRGLSSFGRRLVERCLELGILVDLSHTAERGVIDTCTVARHHGLPVIASHAAARPITQGAQSRPSRHLDRGFSTDAIRAIVETGGCISVILAPYFLRHSFLENNKPDRDADLAFVIGYYEALADLIARMEIVEDPWKHLSFGSDFDGGISSIPTGMDSGADLPRLTEAMIDAGWPRQRIIDVYSENFLRSWQAVAPS